LVRLSGVEAFSKTFEVSKTSKVFFIHRSGAENAEGFCLGELKGNKFFWLL
jgi:hypothetical protein